MTTAAPATPVHRLIPFVHALNVQASLDFYALLGFTPRNTMRAHDGRVQWAWAQSDGPPMGGGSGCRCGMASIMFAQSSGPINAGEQAVLFYMHCENVADLRAHLLAGGIADGGRFSGAPAPGAEHPSPVVFELTRPPHMPAGEMRLHDPDGYCILVGQPA